MFGLDIYGSSPASSGWQQPVTGFSSLLNNFAPSFPQTNSFWPTLPWQQPWNYQPSWPWQSFPWFPQLPTWPTTPVTPTPIDDPAKLNTARDYLNKAFVGQFYGQVVSAIGNLGFTNVRAVADNSMVTMEYRQGRVTVNYDHNTGLVKSVSLEGLDPAARIPTMPPAAPLDQEALRQFLSGKEVGNQFGTEPGTASFILTHEPYNYHFDSIKPMMPGNDMPTVWVFKNSLGKTIEISFGGFFGSTLVNGVNFSDATSGVNTSFSSLQTAENYLRTLNGGVTAQKHIEIGYRNGVLSAISVYTAGGQNYTIDQQITGSTASVPPQYIQAFFIRPYGVSTGGTASSTALPPELANGYRVLTGGFVETKREDYVPRGYTLVSFSGNSYVIQNSAGERFQASVDSYRSMHPYTTYVFRRV